METQTTSTLPAARTLPALRAPAHTASPVRKTITLRGIPADQITRGLPLPTSAEFVAPVAPAFVLQHVAGSDARAAGGSPVTPYRMTAEQVRRVIRTYTGTFAHADERLHVRDASGNLIAAYRAEAGRWIIISAF